jgi:hypothetical protein
MLENNENPSMEEILLSIKSILSGEVEEINDVIADNRADNGFESAPSSKIFDLTKEMLVEAPKAFTTSEK